METIPSTTPPTRIDYIWTHGPLSALLRECRVLFEGAFRTNPDDPKSVALSDHIPVLAVFGDPKQVAAVERHRPATGWGGGCGELGLCRDSRREQREGDDRDVL